MHPSLITRTLASKVQDFIDSHYAGKSYDFQLNAARFQLRSLLIARGRGPGTFRVSMNPNGPVYDGAYTVEVEPRSAIDQLADLI